MGRPRNCRYYSPTLSGRLSPRLTPPRLGTETLAAHTVVVWAGADPLSVGTHGCSLTKQRADAHTILPWLAGISGTAVQTGQDCRDSCD